MKKIDLIQAYDEQTQELLIDETISKNLTDADEYDSDVQNSILTMLKRITWYLTPKAI